MSALAEPSQSCAVSNQNASVDFLKLNVDCFEELFEWLSVMELKQLRLTCKRLKQVVDYYIRTNCPSVNFGVMNVWSHIFSDFRRLNANTGKILKEVRFIDYELSDNYDPEILKYPERITIVYNPFKGNFYENFLKFCTNLKSLSLLSISGGILMGSNNEWLLRQYPMLEHVYLKDQRHLYQIASVDELGLFFELNPNIQSFTTTSSFLVRNSYSFSGSTVKLDKLTLSCDCQGSEMICNLLKLLHEQGFYRRLHFYGYAIKNRENLVLVLSLPGMERLFIKDVDNRMGRIQPLMPDLKEFIFNHYTFQYLEALTKNLMNVERLEFYFARVNDVALFIRNAAKLKHIKVETRPTERLYGMLSTQLHQLNKERGKLSGATKITIYVEEEIYLKLKMKDVKIDLKFINVKRPQAYQWFHEYEIMN